jgi:hypothetical protein
MGLLKGFKSCNAIHKQEPAGPLAVAGHWLCAIRLLKLGDGSRVELEFGRRDGVGEVMRF